MNQPFFNGLLSGRFVLEEFRPLAESIEWELSRVYFQERGSRAFVSDGVPFAINNSGNLSRSAAELLFANLRAAELQGTLEPRVFALELAAR